MAIGKDVGNNVDPKSFVLGTGYDTCDAERAHDSTHGRRPGPMARVVQLSVRTQPLTATGVPSQTSTIPYHTNAFLRILMPRVASMRPRANRY